MQALPGIKVIVMRTERVPYVDQSGLYAIDDAVRSLRQEGIMVPFSGLQCWSESKVSRIVPTKIIFLKVLNPAFAV